MHQELPPTEKKSVILCMPDTVIHILTSTLRQSASCDTDAQNSQSVSSHNKSWFYNLTYKKTTEMSIQKPF